MYVNIRLFISVDFIFIPNILFPRWNTTINLFVICYLLIYPHCCYHVFIYKWNSYNVIFFCTVCIVLKQRFWRGSQCRRHIYFLANENKVSNFQNKWCTVIGNVLERRIYILRQLNDQHWEKHYPSQPRFQSRKIQYGVYADSGPSLERICKS